jgi:hypothetical protein
MERTYRFSYCTVRADLFHGVARTHFLDGAHVDSRSFQTQDLPNPEELGYGGDLRSLQVEEHVLHTWLAEKLSFIASPLFWALGHPLDPPLQPEWYLPLERNFVHDFQRLLNGRPHPSLTEFTLTGRGLSLRELREEAWQLLRSC